MIMETNECDFFSRVDKCQALRLVFADTTFGVHGSINVLKDFYYFDNVFDRCGYLSSDLTFILSD